MIWTQLIFSSCIIFRLKITLLLAQHIPFLVYTSLPPPWQLLDGFAQPFFSGIVIPLTDSHLCGFLANIEAPYPVEHNAAHKCFLSTNCRLPKIIWELRPSFNRNHKVHLRHDNCPPICNYCPCTVTTRLGNIAAAFHIHAWLGPCGSSMLY